MSKLPKKSDLMESKEHPAKQVMKAVSKFASKPPKKKKAPKAMKPAVNDIESGDGEPDADDI